MTIISESEAAIIKEELKDFADINDHYLNNGPFTLENCQVFLERNILRAKCLLREHHVLTVMLKEIDRAGYVHLESEDAESIFAAPDKDFKHVFSAVKTALRQALKSSEKVLENATKSTD